MAAAHAAPRQFTLTVLACDGVAPAQLLASARVIFDRVDCIDPARMLASLALGPWGASRQPGSASSADLAKQRGSKFSIDLPS